jgi:resuscitation-promoting factor RpfB
MRKKFLKFKRHAVRAHRRRIRALKVLSRHPFAVPVFTFIVLLLIGGAVYTAVRPDGSRREAQVVIVSHDGAQQTVPSIEPTVGALLKKLNITLGQGDVVEPAPSTPIKQDDFRINVYRAVPVKVVDGSTATYTFSAATTPRAIAHQTGSNLYAEDNVTTRPTQNFIKDGAVGEEVVINRATPVNVNLYGMSETIRTQAKTVGELLKDRGVKLASSDQVMPAPSTPIAQNQQIFIVRKGTKLESVTQTIPMPVQVIHDSNLAYGTSAVRQQGSAGQQVITYQDQLQNGQIVGRTVIQTVTTQEPVTQIVAQGTSLSGIKGDMALAGISSSDYSYVDYIVSHESGWCPTKAQGQYGACPPYAGYVPSTGGYGLCQSTPGRKMASAGSDWATNPVTQLRWCSGYAHDRYGSWYAAYEHWLSHHNW